MTLLFNKSSIQIQHLLKLNLSQKLAEFIKLNSNTTFVKVKFNRTNSTSNTGKIQIQHLLKLNCDTNLSEDLIDNSNTTFVKVK